MGSISHAFLKLLHMEHLMSCRETRYFKTWKSSREIEQHGLPPEIREITGQRTCSFGNAALQLNDAVLAAETCEELFTPLAPHIALALSGVEIITNGSGSHHQVSLPGHRLDGITDTYELRPPWACCA